ncbi:MAG TPA: lamin tail domain-containing protein [Candidatus Limnocylindrales bacterium]|nr:lamin tail domain-containing protein [Candidatus Limnocylindrales bacterium]
MARPFGTPAVAALVLLVFVAIGLPPASGVRAAEVTWPPSSGLLISELQTGGASASDEFVELYSAASEPIDLVGLELAYASASGATVTRKASWDTSLLVEPGAHLLIANEGGAYAGIADQTYSGGFAATGGAVVLRDSSGTTIDALAWGTAANDLVEGAPAPAPDAGQSLERLPGGLAGSGIDTNDDASDFALRDAPDPQGLTSQPTPWQGSGASPSPSPTATPSSPMDAPSPTPLTEPSPTEPPTASPTAAPSTPTASPSPTTSPTPAPTGSPTTEPTLSPTISPSPSVDPSPTPDLTPIATARSLSDGAVVTIRGVLTTPLGSVESGHAAFVQEDDAGIGLYLAAADWPPLPAGTDVTVHGTLATRYGQLTLRLDAAGDLTAAGTAALPEPLTTATGAATELLEGRLLAVRGTVTAGPDALSDGFAVTVDDGSGPLRVVVAAATGIGESALARGQAYALVGVLGQRDSSGTGMAGYRLYLRSQVDIVAVTPSASPTPTPGGTAGPSPTPSSSATPTGSPGLLTIAAARAAALGTQVTVRGVVTAQVGRVSDERSLAIQDATAGLVVRLDGQARTVGIERGDWIEVSGTLAQRHDDLELRAPDGTKPTVLGAAPLPDPLIVDAAGLGESTEGRLVSLSGMVSERTRSQSGTLTVIVEDASGSARVVFLPAVGAGLMDVARGARVRVTGVAGQYSSAHGRADGYRIWARDLADLVVLAAPPSGSDSGSGSSASRGRGQPGVIADGTARPIDSAVDGPVVVQLAQLERWIGRLVRVAGRVEALRSDALTLEDDAARADVLLGPTLAPVLTTLRLGDLVSVVGYIRRSPDDQPLVVPRGPADISLASSLVAPSRPGDEVAGTVSSKPVATPSAAPVGGPRPSGPDRLGLLAICLSILLAGGAGVAFVVRRW